MVEQKIYFASHGGSMMSELNKAHYDNDPFCDVILQVDGVQLKAHKAILAKVSKYFYLMFTSDMKERQDGVADIKDISSTTMKLILNFIYLSEITLSSQTIEEILAAAHYFHLLELFKFCSDFLIHSINLDNYLKIRDIGMTYSMNVLLETVEEFVEKNFIEITKRENFLQLEKKDVMYVLQLGDQHLKMMIKALFEGSLGWVKHDLEVRKQHLSELLEVIKLHHLPRDYLEDVVFKEELMEETKLKQSLKDGLVFQYHLEPGKQRYQFVLLDKTKIRLFKLLSLQWQNLPDLPHDSSGAAVVAYGDYLYVIGGKNATILKINLHQSNTSWEVERKLSSVITIVNAVVYEGCIIWGSSYNQQVLIKYNPLNQALSKFPLMKKSHSDLSLLSSNGRLYAISSKGIEVYENRSWKVINEKSSFTCRVVMWNDEILSFPGPYIYKSLAYSLKLNEWRSMQCPEPYNTYDVLVMDEDVYLLGSNLKGLQIQQFNNRLRRWLTIYKEEQTQTKISITAI